ncbi:hypothetical protein EJD97_003668 [Solanum chilense]|uniref:Uncharacterized protein n=1 Tax=Solanum chilense TaxID=4083 RepID=A0A6N2CL77_SOLCI|nr:hypothetical protein EJD97_003668 [Solanum chilense]
MVQYGVKPNEVTFTSIFMLVVMLVWWMTAYEITKTVTFELSSIWGALLGACVIHENVELGELSARWLFKLEPENTENYIPWGKIYSAVGRRKDAENVTFDE